MDLRQHIRTIPDYPKAGILFRDVTTLMLNSEAFTESIRQLQETCVSLDFNKIAGIEARGFVFGAALAVSMNKGFIPIRKSGKLPSQTISESYELEYGTDALEIHTDSVSSLDRVLICDDLIATGGTATASIKLVERLGGRVSACAFIVSLVDLGGEEKIQSSGYRCVHLLDYEGL
jgi:adenine phosphoribosyltransferase